MKNNKEQKLKLRIKRRIVLFIILLCLSGITAFPLHAEITWLHDLPWYLSLPTFSAWIDKVYQGINSVEINYPFMAYGTDWLAFSHLVIAVAFFGPLKEPIKNMWVIQFGRIACLMVFPLAFICGSIRGIPFGWQLVDCSFGIFGYALLTLIYKDIHVLENNASITNS